LSTGIKSEDVSIAYLLRLRLKIATRRCEELLAKSFCRSASANFTSSQPRYITHPPNTLTLLASPAPRPTCACPYTSRDSLRQHCPQQHQPRCANNCIGPSMRRRMNGIAPTSPSEASDNHPHNMTLNLTDHSITAIPLPHHAHIMSRSPPPLLSKSRLRPRRPILSHNLPSSCFR
jgi:hypothetical protein